MCDRSQKCTEVVHVAAQGASDTVIILRVVHQQVALLSLQARCAWFRVGELRGSSAARRRARELAGAFQCSHKRESWFVCCPTF